MIKIKNETTWMSYYENSKLIFFITSNHSRDMYYLYTYNDKGEPKRIYKNKNPAELFDTGKKNLTTE